MLIYNKEWEKCAADYSAGELGGAAKFEIGCSVSVECYQNKLVILKD